MSVFNKPYRSVTAVVFAAGIAATAAGQPIIESSGLHTISGEESVDYVGLFGTAELVMTGGVVFDFIGRILEGGSSTTGMWLQDDAEATVTGGTIAYDLHLTGDAELQFVGGAAGEVFCQDDAAVGLTGGALSGGEFADRARFTALGGSVTDQLVLRDMSELTIGGSASFASINLENRANVEMSGGEILLGLRLDGSSGGRMSGGRVGFDIQVNDHAVFFMDGGEARTLQTDQRGIVVLNSGRVHKDVDADGTSIFSMQGGEVLEDVRAGTLGVELVVSGGSIGGELRGGGLLSMSGGAVGADLIVGGELDMSGGEVSGSVLLSGLSQATLTARSFAYDDDGNPGTPARPIEFGGATEMVITSSDPRLAPTGSQDQLALRGLTPVWENGTSAFFDVVGPEGGGWALTLRRASVADLNGDGFVNTLDLVLMLNEWGTSCDPCAADLNGDGFVNIADLSLLLSAWGT